MDFAPTLLVPLSLPYRSVVFVGARPIATAQAFSLPLSLELVLNFAQFSALFCAATLAEHADLRLSSAERLHGSFPPSRLIRTGVSLFASILGLDLTRATPGPKNVLSVVAPMVGDSPTEVDTCVEDGIKKGGTTSPPRLIYPPQRPTAPAVKCEDVEVSSTLIPSPPYHRSLSSIHSAASTTFSTPSPQPTPPSSSRACNAISTSFQSFHSQDVGCANSGVPSAHVARPDMLWHNGARYSTTDVLYREDYVAVFAARMWGPSDAQEMDVVVKVQRAEWPGAVDDEWEAFRRATASGSPFLIKLRTAWTQGDDTFFVMDRYPDTLARVLRDPHVKLFERRVYAAELLLALEALHAQRVLHGDIKPANILLSRSGHIALADFGLSVPGDPCLPATHIQVHNSQGTIGYAAPEVISDTCPYNGFGVSADVWSYGVVLSELFANGELFFQRKTLDATKEATLFMPLAQLAGWVSDPLALELILFILRRDPDERPTLAEIKHHQFFAGVEWKSVAERRYDHT